MDTIQARTVSRIWFIKLHVKMHGKFCVCRWVQFAFSQNFEINQAAQSFIQWNMLVWVHHHHHQQQQQQQDDTCLTKMHAYFNTMMFYLFLFPCVCVLLPLLIPRMLLLRRFKTVLLFLCCIYQMHILYFFKLHKTTSHSFYLYG